MKREGSTKRQAIVLLLSLVLVLALVAALAVGLIRSARERAALEREREEQSKLADKNHASVTRPPRPSQMSGLELLAAGNIANTVLYYFGDDTLYGRGAAEELGINATSYRTILKAGLAEALGVQPQEVRGRVYEGDATEDGSFSPSLAALAADLSYYRTLNFRILLLTPTARTAEAGLEASRDPYTGSFVSDLETLLREVRENHPLCDIILTVPHDANADTAEAMLALAAHYGLVSVDMRAVFADGEGLVHTAGESLGYPTEAGHRAYAEAILTAILTAADEGYSVTPLPTTRLY